MVLLLEPNNTSDSYDTYNSLYNIVIHEVCCDRWPICHMGQRSQHTSYTVYRKIQGRGGGAKGGGGGRLGE